MSHLTKLKRESARIRGQLTRIANTINIGISVSEAKTKLKRIEEIWVAFDKVQADIEDHTPTATAQSQTEYESERQLFEIKYFEAAAMAQRVIDTQPQDQANVQNRNQVQGKSTTRKPKLPEIKLPEFNGEYTKWIFYKTNFETTIHNDADLTPIQKHQYLIGTLKGEALKVIQGFEIGEDNYIQAWNLLKDTYDNQVMIIETHLDELINFPNITRENKAESLRQLIWHIQTHLKSLKALSQPVEHWDTLIIHLAKKKLDFAEQRDWQDTIKVCTMPKLEAFIKFLTERSHMLRMLSQGKAKPVVMKQPQEKKYEKRVVLASTQQNCKLCDKDHLIFRCEELLKHPPEERRKLIIDKKLCANCLQPGHFARTCKGSNCRKCGGRHNALLHRGRVDQSTDNTSQAEQPENVNPGNQEDQFDLFGFSDASEKAIGACIYVTSGDQNNVLQSHLLCTKSRVAPLKVLTISRLELEAALLLSQLCNTVQSACKTRIKTVRLWSDSTIVLGWLQTSPHLLKTFVANRVAKTRELTEGATWQHVRTADNPADILSRGTSIDELKISNLWWHGPAWLREPGQRPDYGTEPEAELPELRLNVVNLMTFHKSNLLQRYSSFSKLCRVIAYCYRFVSNIKNIKQNGPLEVIEIQRAEKIVIRWVQTEAFSEEYCALKANREIAKGSILKSLRPFIDEDDLIRVGGRLQHSDLSEDEKHSWLLPNRHHITHILMREEHQRQSITLSTRTASTHCSTKVLAD